MTPRGRKVISYIKDNNIVVKWPASYNLINYVYVYLLMIKLYIPLIVLERFVENLCQEING